MKQSSARRPRRCAAPLLAALALGLGSSAQAQFNIGAGSSFDLGSGSLNQGCLPLNVAGTLNIQSGQWSGIDDLRIDAAGTLDGGSGVVSLSGDFTRNGTFNAASGELRSVDGCGSAGSTFSAANTFYRLTVGTATGRTLTLPAGAVQTIQQGLSLSGSAGNLLQIRSNAPGTAAQTDLQAGASQNIAYVNVADNHATGAVIAPGTPVSFNSVQGNNTSRWFVGQAAGAVPVPTLGPWATALLALLLAATALRRRL